MLRRTAIPAVVATLALLASACSGGTAEKGSAGANPTLATDPPRTNPTLATLPPATTTTNPYAVPAVIDAAYVNRVLAGLDAIRGDVTRTIVSTKTIPRDAYDRMRAMYGTDEWLQLRIDSFQSDMRRAFAGYSPVPGNQVTTITQLISTSSTCIFARATRDYSAVGPGASATSDRNWVGLKPLDPRRDPHGYNVTSWAFVYDGFPEDRTQPPDPCAK